MVWSWYQKNECPFIRQLHYINEIAMSRVMGLAPGADPA